MVIDSSPPSNWLSHELLVHILEFIESDFATLASCAVVNSAINRAACQILYAKVIYSPAFKPSFDLRDRGAVPEPSLFASACLPQYAPFVLSLTIAGYLLTRPPPSNVFPAALLNAIQSFPNLRRVAFQPSTFPTDLFTEPLKFFGGNPQGEPSHVRQLESLAISVACQDDTRAPLLVQIGGLKKLTLHSPTRAILELLPDWLNRLSDQLSELHLKDNCGSITPGVLNSFLLNDRLQGLRAVTLGLSYSLTDEVVFDFLGRIPNLERLQLRYYLQLKTPKSYPPLRQLRSFTAQFTLPETSSEVLQLCKWIRLAISSSPLQELYFLSDIDHNINRDGGDEEIEVFTPPLHASLRMRIRQSIGIRRDDNDTDAGNGVIEGGDEEGANIAFDSLINHLVIKHSLTVQILDMRSAFIRVGALKTVFTECVMLQEFYVAAGRTALTAFEQHASRMQKLHTAGFNIRNAKSNERRISHERAVQLIRDSGSPNLRRLIVGGMMWQGSYVIENDQVSFAVERVYSQIPPWRR